jgi:probable O-glycosylation ligase (exosortase A-associated)
MKQTALMLVLFTLGSGGAVFYGPFIGLAIYYLFAVLRPQYLWEWALLIDVRWSFYVALATIVSTILYSSGGFRGRTFTSTHSAMVGFAVWVTLSNIFALNSEISSHWYWEYFKIFVMFLCGTVVVRELSQVRILYLIAVWTLGYIAYEINFLYVFDGRLDIFHLGYGGLDNNGAGLMIAMGVPMAYFLWQHYGSYWRWVYLAMVPVMVHAVLMSYSRGAMVSLLLVTPLLIVRSRRRMQMILALIGFLWLVPMLAGEEIRTRFFSVEQYEEDRSAQSRFDSWEAGWRIATDNPVFGVGVRNSESDGIGRAIHSQYIQIAADSGFPALLLYLLLLFGTWKALRQAQKRCRESESKDDWLGYNLACGVEGSMAVFCMGSAFLSLEVFELPYLLILLGLQLSSIVQEDPSAVISPSGASVVSYQPQKSPA